jgi:hypothetical protein
MNEQFSVGVVLGASFRIWLKNLIPFLLITAVIYLPLTIWGVALVQGTLTLDKLHAIVQFSQISVVLTLVLNVAVAASLTYGVVMELQGKHASIGACIATGFTRLLPALGVALLGGLAIVAGMFALVVPGVILACMFYVATPASVIERPGVGGALKRSRELTAGRKGSIFGLLLLLGLIGIGLTQLEKSLLMPSDPAAVVAALPKLMYADVAVKVVIGSLGAVVAAVSYYYLRNEKEGTSINELAKVFE